MDREKVIRELTNQKRFVRAGSEEDKTLDSALSLLKEQEPKQVEAEVINEIDRFYRCPSCHISMILRKQPYCHSCGQELKWE